MLQWTAGLRSIQIHENVTTFSSILTCNIKEEFRPDKCIKSTKFLDKFCGTTTANFSKSPKSKFNCIHGSVKLYPPKSKENISTLYFLIKFAKYYPIISIGVMNYKFFKRMQSTQADNFLSQLVRNHERNKRSDH